MTDIPAQLAGQSVLDGNDIWEALFSILKGNVPDEMTVEVCEQLADAFNRRAILEEKIAASQRFAAANTRGAT